MLGDIGVQYCKQACYGNMLRELQVEVIERTAERIVKENLI